MAFEEEEISSSSYSSSPSSWISRRRRRRSLPLRPHCFDLRQSRRINLLILPPHLFLLSDRGEGVMILLRRRRRSPPPPPSFPPSQ
jgi:hypothetical protein